MMPRIAILALALLLGACATAPPSPLPDLAGVPSAFELSARLAVRQGDRSDIARLRWTRRPGSDQWVFSTPIGNEVARIESSARGATLARAGGPSEEAESFASLTDRVLGVALDPDHLSAWLHGKPGPSGLPQDWTVTIDETQSAGSIALARRITATRGDVVVRLFVDSYRTIEE